MIAPMVEKAQPDYKPSEANDVGFRPWTKHLVASPSTSTMHPYLGREEGKKGACTDGSCMPGSCKEGCRGCYFEPIIDQVDRIQKITDFIQLPQRYQPDASSLTFLQQEEDDKPTKYTIGTELCTLTTSRKERCLTKLRWRRLVLAARVKKSPIGKIGAQVKRLLPVRHTCQKNRAIYECKACANDLMAAGHSETTQGDMQDASQ